MSGLVDLVAPPALALAAALVVAGLGRRRSAAWRHHVLAVGIGAALVAAPARLVVPAWTLPVEPAPRQVVVLDVSAAVDRPAPSLAEPARLDAIALARRTWAAGSLVSLAWLLTALVRLKRHTARARPAGRRWQSLATEVARALGVTGPVRILVSTPDAGPAAWGWRRPVILLPDSADAWDDERARMVLWHEMAHIRRGDWIVQMASDLLTAAYWFNPLAWVTRAWIRRLSDRACDDEVVTGPFEARRYAGQLVEIARRQRQHVTTAVSMARRSTLERRITAMLNHHCNRQPASRRLRLVTAAAGLALLLPAAGLRVAAMQSGPAPLTVHVYDMSGAVLPGVAIALEDVQGKRTATTEASGRTVFEAVPPGEYTLEASLVGFRTLRAPVTLANASDWRLTVTLQVGELVETVSVRGRRSPPPAPSGVVQPLRVGGNIRVPKKLNDVRPVYPASMTQAGLEGVVPMEALIGRDGTVTSVRVLSAQVHPEFARAAEAAVRQWLFSPTLLNGEAIEVRMTVTVRFSLEG